VDGWSLVRGAAPSQKFLNLYYLLFDTGVYVSAHSQLFIGYTFIAVYAAKYFSFIGYKS